MKFMTNFCPSANLRSRLPFLVAGMVCVSILAACQSNPGGRIIGLGGNSQKTEPEKIDVAVLEIYCPKIQLRSGTAYYNTFEKGGEEDPDRVIYQASITQTSRSCVERGEEIAITAGVAGRVVPGPKGKAGTITMPIRIAVVRGDEVLYSQLHNAQAQIGNAATPFVFTDPNIVIAKPNARNVLIYVGYDEGPYDTP